MNIIDILILAVLGVSLIFGLYRGFISGVLSVAALIGAAAAAFAVSPSLAAWLQGNVKAKARHLFRTSVRSEMTSLVMRALRNLCDYSATTSASSELDASRAAAFWAFSAFRRFMKRRMDTHATHRSKRVTTATTA